MKKGKPGNRVVVAMSGGVDSSVAALLLKERGFEVIGVTLRLWVDPLAESNEADSGSCCSSQAAEDAARVAAMLDIPHYVLNMKDLFYRQVVCNFTAEYLLGRTPNPCIECNRFVKFSALLEKAKGLGADYLATGHYALIKYETEKESYALYKGLDPYKDQSYMLYVLTQKELASILFPLGDKRKEEVRKIAKANKLLVAEKADSQEICFIPDNNYRAFLERECPEAVREGEIVSVTGIKLGYHRGIAFYTIGQRKGLGLTSKTPLYVIGIDPYNNRLVVGEEPALYSREMIVENTNYLAGSEPDQPLEIEVKIRYRSVAVEAVLHSESDGLARVVFKEKQKAVTPGQSAVFYRGDEVIGGGIISLKSNRLI